MLSIRIVVVSAKPLVDIWTGYPQLERICSCESWGDPNKIPRQLNSSGTELLGYPNPHDKGECQINQPTWGKAAQHLGFDINATSGIGNVDMAKWIYDNDSRHAENWKWSESCWK